MTNGVENDNYLVAVLFFVYHTCIRLIFLYGINSEIKTLLSLYFKNLTKKQPNNFKTSENTIIKSFKNNNLFK